MQGLDVSPAAMEDLLRVDRDEWKAELASQREFFAKFGARLPAEMEKQAAALGQRLG